MHDPSANSCTDSSKQSKSKSPGSRKCHCCPYGYHLDLDFVRYCEKVANSQLLPNARHTIPRSRAVRKKRESIESLLGLSPHPTQELIQKANSYSLRNGIQEKADRFTDELDKAVSDFESIFNSTLRGKTIDERLLENKKRRDLEFDFSSQSLERINEKTESHAEDAKLPINGINNASAVTLQEIRDQMAASLAKMKKLEEEAKSIPNLQSQIQKLRWENRRLTKLLETKTDQHENIMEKLRGHEAKEDNTRHTRTIGTGCTVLMRDVSTWDRIIQKTTGTNPPLPTASINRQTNTDPILQPFKGIIEPEKQAVKKSFANCSVQTTEWPVKVPTKELSSQTDHRFSKVSTRDASVQHISYKKETSLRDIGCQADIRKKIILKYDAGVQVEKNPTCNANTQTENVPLKIPVIKESSSQVPKIPHKITCKDFGIQNKPLVADIGIGSKLYFNDNSSQTLQLKKKDIGVNVYRRVSFPKVTNIGINTEIERKDDYKPTSVSKMIDTFDLCKKIETSVNATPQLKDASIDTLGLTEYKKIDGYLKTPKKYTQSLTNLKEAATTDSVQNLREKIEKESSTEGANESVSPSVAIVSKPYEKKEPSKEMKGAMKVLNDSLQKSPAGDMPKSMRNAINIIQQEWFKISSTAEANPLDVEDYIDCFEELSVGLLEYIVNMTDVSGNTAMHYAVSNGNFDVVSILLDSKVCNINKLNTAGYTCIMLVALAKVKSAADRQVVRRLFHMADVNIRAKQHGQTALMLAVSHGRIDTVELLLESGADINIQDEDGSTALMCAAEHGYIDIVKLLLAQPDCDLTITDLDGNTALNIAMEAGNRDIGVLLYAQEHFSRGSSPFSSLKTRRGKSSTPTLKTRTPTPPNCSQEHSL